MTRSQRRLIGSIALGACFVSALVACASLVVPDIDTVDAPVPEAGTDTGTTPTPPVDASKDPCGHVLPPPMPPMDDNPTKDVGELNFILRETHVLVPFTYDGGAFMDGPAPNTTLGFDLDNACTCQSDLRHGQNACAAKKAQCDQDGGVDNQLPGLMTLLTAVMPNVDVDKIITVNDRITAGDSAIMITLRGYNGLANDTAVTAVIHGVARPEVFPNADGGPQCNPDAGDASALIRPPSFQDKDDGDGGIIYDPSRIPLFDGCDNWGEVEATPAIEAYVANHVLVISTKVAVPLQLAGSILNVETTKMTAVLVPDGKGGFTLEDGNVGARAPTLPLLAAMSTLSFSSTGGQLCYGTKVEQGFLIGQLCGAVDILANSSSDFYADPESGAQVSCDALSVAFAFRGELASYGVHVDASVVNRCTDAAPFVCP